MERTSLWTLQEVRWLSAQLEKLTNQDALGPAWLAEFHQWHKDCGTAWCWDVQRVLGGWVVGWEGAHYVERCGDMWGLHSWFELIWLFSLLRWHGTICSLIIADDGQHIKKGSWRYRPQLEGKMMVVVLTHEKRSQEQLAVLQEALEGGSLEKMIETHLLGFAAAQMFHRFDAHESWEQVLWDCPFNWSNDWFGDSPSSGWYHEVVTPATLPKPAAPVPKLCTSPSADFLRLTIQSSLEAINFRADTKCAPLRRVVLNVIMKTWTGLVGSFIFRKLTWQVRGPSQDCHEPWLFWWFGYVTICVRGFQFWMI